MDILYSRTTAEVESSTYEQIKDNECLVEGAFSLFEDINTAILLAIYSFQPAVKIPRKRREGLLCRIGNTPGISQLVRKCCPMK
jgi:hypothetical protein